MIKPGFCLEEKRGLLPRILEGLFTELARSSALEQSYSLGFGGLGVLGF